MKATIFHAPLDVRVETVPDPPVRERTDAVVRVVNAAICGSDLWFYRGISKWEPGWRTGHEFIGRVEAVGAGVRDVKVGDVVAAPFAFSDGSCEHCLHALYTSCEHGGMWGREFESGGQGELVRVPFADAVLVKMPEAVAHDARKRTAALALTDVMSTGHHGVVRAQGGAGKIVMVIGDGAVGLCAVLAARRLNADRIVAVGHHAARLAIAKQFGASDLIDSKGNDTAAQIIELTRGGPHAVVEAVGSQATMDLAIAVCRPGGTVSYVGVPHGVKTFDSSRVFGENITIAGALAPVRAYLPELLADVANGTIDPSPVFDVRLPLDRTPEGYALMHERRAIKVALEVSAP